MSVPNRIGRYRVTRHLGSGAFATVWLADDDLLESPVAIKVLAENWAHHPDIRARFVQEGRIMRRADSDRLIRVLDTGELPDGRPYLVMTYASGGSLADRLAAGPMPVAHALRVAVDIARAVAVLHEAGVLHRDLKPSNVLLAAVAGRQRVVVADLGLAKAIAHASGFTVVAGTPGYMAPEQARPGGGLDVRADVYAIGAVTYHMLTGQLPGTADAAGTMSGNSDPPVRPSKIRRGVPKRVDDIVLRALHRNPQRRWSSAAAFAAALTEAADPLPSRKHHTARQRVRQILRVPALALMATATLATAGSTSVHAAAPGWVRVGDVSGTFSIAVPTRWAWQLKDAGWNPAVVRLPPNRAPALVVGTDLAAWPDPASATSGVFVGVSKSLDGRRTVPALPAHDQCARQPDRAVTVGNLTGQVRRWTGCGGTSISFSEVVLAASGGDYGVYIQIKQLDQTDHTDEVLRTLRMAKTPTS